MRGMVGCFADEVTEAGEAMEASEWCDIGVVVVFGLLPC